MNSDPAATGVYSIRCTVNGKVYVGSAARSFKNRWTHHRKKLRGGYHENDYLQATWKKYGEAAFEFGVLEECPPEHCVVREQFWIDFHQAAKRNTGFNLSPTAGSNLGMKASDATRKKLSEAQKGKRRGPRSEAHRKALSDALRGRSPTEEHRKASAEGRRGLKLSEAQCKAISERQKGRKHTEATRQKMKGRIISQAAREAVSKKMTGRKLSEEHRRKVADARRGKPLSEAHRKAVSEGLKGRKRHFNDAWRKAMSESRKGKPKSPEHCARISEANRRRWAAYRERQGLGEKPGSTIGETVSCVFCGEPFVKQTANVKTCGVECRTLRERRRSVNRAKAVV